jgi:predicted XRE-type DNA-binding protein
MPKPAKIERSSGNVFADLGLPDAEELQTKARLAVEIVLAIEARSLSQVAAAKILGVSQPKISALKAFKLEGFSVERLMTFLTLLGRDVEIRITARPRTASQGHIRVAGMTVKGRSLRTNP